MQDEIEFQDDRSETVAVAEADWTESEWFNVWLKLARHEYEPAKSGG